MIRLTKAQIANANRLGISPPESYPTTTTEFEFALGFVVPGKPAPGGSKKSFINPKTGRIVTIDDAKNNKGWRATVALFGIQSGSSLVRDGLIDEPIKVEMTFFETRPKSHYGTGKNSGRLKPDAPKYPTGKPDALKLARSTEDALTGVIWKDDASTIEIVSRKQYHDKPGVLIEIFRLKAAP